MKQGLLYILLFMLYGQAAFSQNTKMHKEGVIPKSINIISAVTGIATGNFSHSHSLGLSAIYQHGISLREKKVNFTVAGLLNATLGRKKIVSGYSYKYPVYTIAAVLSGLSYSPFTKTSANFLIGPGLTAYNKLSYFAFTGHSSFHYKVSSKFLAGASITGIKTKGSSILFITGLNASMILD